MLKFNSTVHLSFHLSICQCEKSTGSMLMSLGIHTLSTLDFHLDWDFLLFAQNRVCRWCIYTFCIPVSDWWDVVARLGVFCPHLWAQLINWGCCCDDSDTWSKVMKGLKHSANSSVKLSGRHCTQTKTREVRWAARSSGHWVVTSMFA